MKSFFKSSKVKLDDGCSSEEEDPPVRSPSPVDAPPSPTCEWEANPVGTTDSTERPTFDGQWTPLCKGVEGIAVNGEEGEGWYVSKTTLRSLKCTTEGEWDTDNEVHLDTPLPEDCTLGYSQGHIYAVSKGSTVSMIETATGTTNVLCKSTSKIRGGSPLVMDGLLMIFGGRNEGNKKPSSSIRVFDTRSKKWVTSTPLPQKMPFKEATPLVVYDDRQLIVSNGTDVVGYCLQSFEETGFKEKISIGSKEGQVTCSGNSIMCMKEEEVVSWVLTPSGWEVVVVPLGGLFLGGIVSSITKCASRLLVQTATGECWHSVPVPLLMTTLAGFTVSSPVKKGWSLFRKSSKKPTSPTEVTEGELQGSFSSPLGNSKKLGMLGDGSDGEKEKEASPARCTSGSGGGEKKRGGMRGFFSRSSAGYKQQLVESDDSADDDHCDEASLFAVPAPQPLVTVASDPQ